jgi:hypothetical protein
MDTGARKMLVARKEVPIPTLVCFHCMILGLALYSVAETVGVGKTGTPPTVR